MRLELCRSRYSPYVERVQIALKVKGLAFQERYASLVDKPGWFLELAPTGKVPVLVIDGTPVCESSAILELLDELVHDPTLFPLDPLDRATVRAAIRWLDLEVFLAAYDLLREVVQWEARPDGRRRSRFEKGRVFLKPRSEWDEPRVRAARARAGAALDSFARIVARRPAPARTLALAIAFEPLVHNPGFVCLADPALPEWARLEPAVWTDLAPLAARAKDLPVEHIVWMYE